MSKKKNVKRSGLSDAVLGKKSNAAKVQKTNPFEVHVNRQKFSVLNRDTTNDRGLPGVSRAKAAKRRQETLGTEMDTMHKTNRFKDNRLSGGRFKSGEDLATAKFAKEMMSRHESKSSKRKSLFNLDGGGGGMEGDSDEEPPIKQLLTHKGQTLKEIEQFQDAVSDGDEDPEDSEMLNAEFTDAAHFGGGSSEADDRKSRKDLIDDLISETKRRKADAAKEKDQVLSMTEKLDETWKSLIPVMGKFHRTDEERVKPDAYDTTMREMIFERRGEPTDKLKTKEELAKVEREKLERMERERLRRMRDDTLDEKPKHRSADDLDDQFYGEELDGDGDEEQLGTANVQDPENEGEDDSGAEEGVEDDEEEDGEEGDSEDDDDSDEKDEDHFSDLKSSEDEADDEQENLKQKKKEVKSKKVDEKPAPVGEALPFTFDLPDSYEELSSLLLNKSPSDQTTILERIIKCNPVSLDAANKDKLISLAAFLCQYFNDLFDCDDLTEDNAKKAFEVFDKFTPFILQLAEMNSLAIGNLLREVLTEKQGDLKKAKRYPNLDVLIFLRLVRRLFSTSDFKHGVVTPAFVLISQLLTRCPVESGRDIARGLLLVTIALDYTAQSKRLLPAVIVFLDGVLRLAVPKKTVDLCLPAQLKNAPDLSVSGGGAAEKGNKKKNKAAAIEVKDLQMMAKDLVNSGEVDEEFKIRAVNAAVLLAKRFLEQIQENVAAVYYAGDLDIPLKRLNISSYPEKVQANLKSLQTLVARLQEKKLTPLKLRDQPVKQLRMLEPKFESETYHDKRVKGKPTGKSLQEAMRHKVKREMKGAMRDIKLDNAFLAKNRLNKQRVMDRERKEKVKRIFAEASIQQGELNAMDRQNSRKSKK